MRRSGAAHNTFKHGLYKTKEYQVASAHQRRAKKLSAGGTFGAADIKLKFKEQKGKCNGCGVRISKSGRHKYRADHIIPLNPRPGLRPGLVGGTNAASNIQLLCQTCNPFKTDKPPEQFNAEMFEAIFMSGGRRDLVRPYLKLVVRGRQRIASLKRERAARRAKAKKAKAKASSLTSGALYSSFPVTG
jgi:5-methylcytosine-specific restriction endonuclease McrA